MDMDTIYSCGKVAKLLNKKQLYFNLQLFCIISSSKPTSQKQTLNEPFNKPHIRVLVLSSKRVR